MVILVASEAVNETEVQEAQMSIVFPSLTQQPYSQTTDVARNDVCCPFCLFIFIRKFIRTNYNERKDTI